jgi:nitrogen fixation protein FixH
MKKPHLFPGIVFGLLGLNVSIVGFTLYLAYSDRSFAVEPDYYQKAIGWDDTAAALERSIALGWTATFQTGDVGALGRNVSLTLADRVGAPIESAAVSLVAFHNARAAQQLRCDLSPSGRPGVYTAQLDLARPGLWEFRITATRGPDVFTAVVRRELPGAPR